MRRSGNVLGLAALVGLALVTTPGGVARLGADFDSGWRWAVDQFANLGAAAKGREMPVFPLGPLGHWLVLLPAHARAGTLTQAALHWTLVVGLLCSLRRAAPQAARHGLVAAGLLAAYLVARPPDWIGVVALWILCGLYLDLDERDGWRSAAFSFGLPIACSFLALLRPSSGVAAATAVGLAVALQAWRARRRLWVVAWAAAGATAAALLFIAAFPSLGAFVRWARHYAVLASAHSGAMSLEAPSPLLLAAGLLMLALFTLQALLHLRRRSPQASLALIGLPLLWMAFKHGFQRQDAHVAIFFFVSILLATGLLARAPRVGFGPSAVFLLAAVSTGFAAARGGDFGALSRPGAVRALFSGQRLADQIAALGRRPASPCPIAWIGDAAEEVRLPARWQGRIAASSSVDLVPARLQRLATDGEAARRWRPSPTLQTFLAVDPALDRLAAEHFRTAGPELLLAEVYSLDRRPMIWDTPVTWRTIQSHYDVVDAEADLLLLRRRSTPRRWAFGPPRPLPASAAGSIVLPPVGPGDWPLLFVSVRPSALARLWGLFLRFDPVLAEFEARGDPRSEQRRAPGARWRILETARGGLLAVVPPADGADLRRLLEGGRPRPLRRFRVLTGRSPLTATTRFEVAHGRLIE